jgi:TonB-dependent receptor
MLGSVASFAQEDGVETVYVTGYRASLEKSLDIKRASSEMVDAISAEDVGKFPDSNLAESLQRLPGVAVDRDNGEGRTITVRGLNADFTRVTVNGLEALSTAGSNQSGDDPNRSRAFDFNTFASELFSGLKVHKSQAADVDEGSLGATVELATGRPFDVGDKSVVSIQNAWYEQGKPFNPRVSGLYSQTFLGGRLGFLVSSAYSMRHQMLDGYQRQAGQSDFLYRQTYFYGPKNGTDTIGYSVKGANNKALYYPTRFGFAAPAGTPCAAANANDINSIIPGQALANASVCDAYSGSNAAAYNTTVKNIAGISSGLMPTDKSYKAYYGGTGILDRDRPFLTMIPSLTALNKRELYTTRLGNTASVEWQPDDHTLIIADALYATSYQNSTNYQVGLIGTNRGNQTQQLAAVTAAATTGTAYTNYYNSVNTAYQQSAYYKGCTASAAKPGYADVACNSGQLAGYNTNAALANPTQLLNQLISFVGKPATKVAQATVTNNQATYLQLANIDLRSAADSAKYTTEFMQGTLRVEEEFSSKLKADLMFGFSQSRNKQVGILAEFNRMDMGTYNSATNTCTYCFTYDATAGGEMPSMEFATDSAGYTVADPGYWNFVKGFSALRHYIWDTNNKFRNVKANVQYSLTDQIDLKAGFSGRIYDFRTSKTTRVVADTYNLGLDQINAASGTSYTVADLGQRLSYGSGITTPEGTPSAIFVPNLDAFRNIYGLGSNAVTSFGSGATAVEQNNVSSDLYSANAGSAYAANYRVSEHDKAYYAQADFHDIQIFNRELRGNIGLRFVTTEVQADGRSVVANSSSTGHSSYNDLLPSVNMAYSLADDMQIRFAAAKVMARPQLAAMSPSINKLTVPSSEPFTTGTAEIGNPYLKPFRANTVDFSYEWYFSEGSAISVAVFSKWVKGIIQQVITPDVPITQVLSPETRAALATYYGGLNTVADTTRAKFLLDDTNAIDITRFENTGNGVLNGLEITWQQQLNFLPHPFDGFGINANYTLLHSKMNYLIQPAIVSNGSITQAAVFGPGPWTGASPVAWNATVFYDGKDWADRPWSARVSGAYRSKFAYKYPIATGTAAPGYSDSPVVNDYIYTASTVNIDASVSWDYTDWMQFRIDASNLTNQTDSRSAYSNLADPAIAYYAATGRQVFAGVRMKF